MKYVQQDVDALLYIRRRYIHASETGTQLIIMVHIKKKKGKTTIAEKAADEFYILLKRNIRAHIHIHNCFT